MKITADAGKLASALALVAALAPTGKLVKNIPVLGAVKLSAGDSAVIASLYNGDVQLALTIPANVVAPGELAVNAGTLARLTAGFPKNSTIEITVEDKVALVRSGRSLFRLPVFAVSDLPALILADELARVTLTRADLIELLRPTFAISPEEARYYLNGILLHDDGDGHLVAVATDGHRLAIAAIANAAGLSADHECVVPSFTVKALGKLLSAHRTVTEITLRRSATLLEIAGGPFTLLTKLIDGVYPDYRRAVGSRAGINSVVVDREAMMAVLARIDAVAGAGAVAGLTWGGPGQDGELHVCATKHNGAAADVVTVTDMRGTGHIAFATTNGMDLLESFAAETVTIDAGTGPGAPVWVTDSTGADTFVTMVMPVVWSGGPP